jgi:peptide/nickel transport system substrate-binding protein
MKSNIIHKTVSALGVTLMLGFISPVSAADECPVKGGTLVWGHSETTQNLYTHQTGTISTMRILQNIHDGLVTTDKNLNIIPELAESYEVSKDGMSYTFKLRNGVKFHDGSDMTSADVKYSFEKIMDPETGAVNKPVFNSVGSIETPDDHTVVIKMDSVNAPFLGRLAALGAGAVIPKGSAETQGENPVGAGPLKFVRREFGNEVELERFDDYWNGAACIDRLIAREVTEPTVRLTGLRTGEMHLINDIPTDRIDEIKADKNLEVLSWSHGVFDFVNLNYKHGPFQDERVRLAIDYMIDKETLLQGALWGQGKTAASPGFASSASYNKSLTQRPQDIAKAKSLLAEAGYGPGDLKVVFKATTNYPYHVEAAQILVEWFREAGVELTIEQLTWADWLSQVWVDKDFQMSMMNFNSIWEEDFLYYSLYNSTGGFNYRGINDPVIDELTEKARVTVDDAARADIYREVQQRVFDKVHDIVVWHRNSSFGAQKNVGGLDTLVNADGATYHFHRVWLKE